MFGGKGLSPGPCDSTTRGGERREYEDDSWSGAGDRRAVAALSGDPSAAVVSSPQDASGIAGRRPGSARNADEDDGPAADASRSGDDVVRGVERAATDTSHGGVQTRPEQAKPHGAPAEQVRGDRARTQVRQLRTTGAKSRVHSRCPKAQLTYGVPWSLKNVVPRGGRQFTAPAAARRRTARCAGGRPSPTRRRGRLAAMGDDLGQEKPCRLHLGGLPGGRRACLAAGSGWVVSDVRPYRFLHLQALISRHGGTGGGCSPRGGGCSSPACWPVSPAVPPQAVRRRAPKRTPCA